LLLPRHRRLAAAHRYEYHARLARSLQGIATGLASGPIGAALINLQPAGSQRAPLVTSAFSTLGLALGALITSALVQYG
jgi:hypothetical protein